MGLRLTSPPAIEPVSLEEIKLHLRLDSGITEDALLSSLITAARQYCEGFQRRAYITQTWQMWLDRFPAIDNIYLPWPPLQSVSSIKYYDTEGVESTLHDSNYYVDTNSQPGRLSLNYGKSWPTTALRPTNGVCVTFVCGYGDTAADVPVKVLYGMKLLIGHYYENREAVSQSQLYPAPMSVDALLWQDRCF